MSNVLEHTKQQQVLALGRLGWTLSRIQATTGIRRETISGYLKAAGIPVRRRGRPSESKPKPAISDDQVSTDPGPGKPAISEESVDRFESAKTGHQGGGVHRRCRDPAPRPCAQCERVRAVSRAD